MCTCRKGAGLVETAVLRQQIELGLELVHVPGLDLQLDHVHKHVLVVARAP